VDFPAPTGARVVAAAAGRVVSVGWDAGWGNHIVVAHGSGVSTLVAHLSSIAVRRGRRVGAGTTIGRVGATGAATGPHLHLEVFSRGANVDPLRAIR
jgi:murein DD-endopeptidase MepM/ murein hydrolase activator NlpD